MRFRATQLGRRLQRGHTLQRRCYVAAHSTQGTSSPPPGGDGAAEGGCCTPGALCHVARREGRSRGRLLHSWGAFFGLVQRKRPRPRKENRFATVSHDPATTQPGTVSYRAERISGCESIARLRRPFQKQAPNLQAAQPSCTHHPSAVREASPRSAMHKYPLTKFPLPVC